MKVLSWIIAFCGLWEFGDIAALFVPDFGKIPSFIWNHLIVGLILMIVGVWAARTSNAGTAKTMNVRAERMWHLSIDFGKRLTPRAPEGWDSPRFQAVCVAQAGSGKAAFSPPAHPRVTHTVGRLFQNTRQR